jgi:hypothetical protein
MPVLLATGRPPNTGGPWFCAPASRRVCPFMRSSLEHQTREAHECKELFDARPVGRSAQQPVAAMHATVTLSGNGPRSADAWPSSRARTRRPSPGLALRGEEGRGFLEDLALLGEHPDLATQPAQLVALLATQALRLALVDIDQATPVAQRLLSHTRVTSHHALGGAGRSACRWRAATALARSGAPSSTTRSLKCELENPVADSAEGIVGGAPVDARSLV